MITVSQKFQEEALAHKLQLKIEMFDDTYTRLPVSTEGGVAVYELSGAAIARNTFTIDRFFSMDGKWWGTSVVPDHVSMQLVNRNEMYSVNCKQWYYMNVTYVGTDDEIVFQFKLTRNLNMRDYIILEGYDLRILLDDKRMTGSDLSQLLPITMRQLVAKVCTDLGLTDTASARLPSQADANITIASAFTATTSITYRELLRCIGEWFAMKFTVSYESGFFILSAGYWGQDEVVISNENTYQARIGNQYSQWSRYGVGSMWNDSFVTSRSVPGYTVGDLKNPLGMDGDLEQYEHSAVVNALERISPQASPFGYWFSSLRTMPMPWIEPGDKVRYTAGSNAYFLRFNQVSIGYNGANYMTSIEESSVDAPATQALSAPEISFSDDNMVIATNENDIACTLHLYNYTTSELLYEGSLASMSPYTMYLSNLVSGNTYEIGGYFTASGRLDSPVASDEMVYLEKLTAPSVTDNGNNEILFQNLDSRTVTIHMFNYTTGQTLWEGTLASNVSHTVTLENLTVGNMYQVGGYASLTNYANSDETKIVVTFVEPAPAYSIVDVTVVDAGMSSGLPEVYVYDGQNSTGVLRGIINSEGVLGRFTIESGYIFLVGGQGWLQDPGTCTGGVTFDDYDEGNGMRYIVTGDGKITDAQFGTCFVEGTRITLADGSMKNVEDITYDDDLLVWDFYTGQMGSAKPIWIMKECRGITHKRVTMDDGTVLKLVGGGKQCHRVYDVDAHEFRYANECVGDRVFKQDGSTARIVSCVEIREPIKYYNLTTEKYLDCFAEGVLTGSRLNNMYHIGEGMKYDSDERLISEEEEKSRWEARKRNQKPRLMSEQTES